MILTHDWWFFFLLYGFIYCDNDYFLKEFDGNFNCKDGKIDILKKRSDIVAPPPANVSVIQIYIYYLVCIYLWLNWEFDATRFSF